MLPSRAADHPLPPRRASFEKVATGLNQPSAWSSLPSAPSGCQRKNKPEGTFVPMSSSGRNTSEAHQWHRPRLGSSATSTCRRHCGRVFRLTNRPSARYGEAETRSEFSSRNVGSKDPDRDYLREHFPPPPEGSSGVACPSPAAQVILVRALGLEATPRHMLIGREKAAAKCRNNATNR